MSKEETKRNAVTEFILRICILERYIEIKRQTLCNKEDFQPYVAFMRINRDSGHSITPSMIHKFLADNLLEVSLRRCQILVEHYDADKDGVLSYKEFIEVLLPKEHPELRAFVAQQECFVITKDEYLSYETECCLASLLEREVYFFDDSLEQKLQMTDDHLLTPAKIMELVDSAHGQNFNFTNLQQFFNKIGLLPYDAEIINFLRRTDKDDDGVVNLPELEYFLSLYDDQREPLTSSQRQLKASTSRGVSEEKVRRASPNRKIVDLKGRLPEEPPAKQSALLETQSRVSHGRGERSSLQRQEGYPASLTSQRASARNNLGASAGLHASQPVLPPANPPAKTYIEERTSIRRSELVQRQARQSEAQQDSFRAPPESQSTRRATPTRPAQRESLGRLPAADSERAEPPRDRSSIGRDRPVRDREAVRDSGDQERPRQARDFDREKPRERDTERDRLHERQPAAGDRGVSERAAAPDIRRTPTKPSYTPGPRDSSSSRLSGLQLREETAKAPNQSDETFGNNSNYESAEQKLQNIFKQDSLNNSLRQSDLKRSNAPAFGTAERFKYNETPQSLGPNSTVKSHARHEHVQPSDKKEPAKPSQPGMAGSSLEEKCSESIYKSFKLILNQERNLELARRELVTKNDFDVSLVFSKIDKRNRSWFTIEDFRMFLSEIGLKNIDNRALMDLYSSYDVNQNCLLNFDQLVDMVCPADNKYAMYLNKSEKRVGPVQAGPERDHLRAAGRRLQPAVQPPQKSRRCQETDQARKPRPQHHLRYHRL